MGVQLFTGLTGFGYQATTDATPFAMRVHVDDLGPLLGTNVGANQHDTGDMPRYSKIGWWAWWEDVGVLDPSVNGPYLSPPFFIYFTGGGFASDYPTIFNGIAGFYYNLGPGVEASFTVYG